MKRLGLLTSGGDCAGLNAVIRAVTIHAESAYGWEVIGIRKGTAGLMTRPLQFEELDRRKFSGSYLRAGGTVLGTTNSGNPFEYPLPDGTTEDRSELVCEGIRMLELDGIIGVGGDGSFAILRRLAQQGGFRLIGIPKTIDNDVGATENAIGYTTAVATATMALDHLQPTAASHDRVMVLEVMGRDAGHIALNAGIAGGADVILIPEVPYDMEHVTRRINSIKAQGRNFALVVVAEAVKDIAGGSIEQQHAGGGRTYGGVGHLIGDEIAKRTGAETRVTVLGHIQRGGEPVAYDRILASAFGVHAVDLLATGKSDRMVAWQSRDVVSVPLADAIKTYHQVDLDGALVKTARALGVSFGD